MVRCQSRRPDVNELWERLRYMTNERRGFGYRWLNELLCREETSRGTEREKSGTIREKLFQIVE